MPLGRAERTLFFAIGGLFAAIVVMAVRTPRPPSHPAAPHADSVVAQGEPDSGAPPVPFPRVSSRPIGGTRDIAMGLESSANPAPIVDTADVRARLAAAENGTYLLPMLADGDWYLSRWPDRRADGLRVWVRTSSNLEGWTPAYAQMARDVFDQWGSSRSPLRFVYVLDSASAEVTVTWIDRFPAEAGLQIGNTTRIRDRYGWMVAASIQVAMHDPHGRVFTPSELIGIVRHEAGHALGLGHSPDTTSMMYPEERVHDITDKDMQTLRLLYTLPPGSMREIIEPAAP